MRKLSCCLVLLLGVLGFAAPAQADICTIDDVPAATLLLPYFEVDLANRAGVNTLFSINNASATAVLAHVTVWTDESIPTLDFDIYLTGYDVQTISLRDIFEFGNLPITASDGQDLGDSGDPNDGISNQGAISQDINFASCGGRLPYPPGILNSLGRTDDLQLAHTGQFAPAYGGCLAADHGDDIARGYITVDTVTQCNLLFPSSPGYFSTGIASTQNVLWGDYFYVNPSQDFAQGETLVHIEACPGTFGGFDENCPFLPGEYTFYGRYSSVAGQDTREPLATTFATRYVSGGGFDGGTDLIVWRDSKTIPTGANGVHSCAADPAWFPLNQADVVGFDEAENPEDLCFTGDIISPVLGGAETCFPLEAQRVSVTEGSAVGSPLAPSSPFGWLYLNLNHSITGDPFPGVAQAWVTTIMSAEGRYSVGFDAIQLDSACEGLSPILIP